MSEIIFDSNTTKKTLQDNSKTDGFLESKGISINKPTAGVYVRCKPGSKRGQHRGEVRQRQR